MGGQWTLIANNWRTTRWVVLVCEGQMVSCFLSWFNTAAVPNAVCVCSVRGEIYIKFWGIFYDKVFVNPGDCLFVVVVTPRCFENLSIYTYKCKQWCAPDFFPLGHVKQAGRIHFSFSQARTWTWIFQHTHLAPTLDLMLYLPHTLSHTRTNIQTHKLVFQAHSRLNKTRPKQAFTMNLVHNVFIFLFFMIINIVKSSAAFDSQRSACIFIWKYGKKSFLIST